ncbi:CBS domain containing protein [Desulfocucumis palustris]|uniref:CBS domain containing protein n=1 Tax=Desulfocucumis palustris TaxID=1898651 RepID=A0A2L2XBS7_9FIRM|nr:CBS domain-containing protein [Desulfocucumis palustris]GBF33542.1 CBS domain containing protein [Desulfocucumis palustris]
MAAGKTAEQIMVPLNDYNTISENATVYDAIKVLKESFHRDGRAWYGHRSVIATDAKGQPTGILTLRGILQAAGLRDMEKDLDFKTESWGWYYIKRLREESRLSVRDVMQPLRLAQVRAQDGLTDVARVMLKNKVNSVSVSKNGKTIGIVRPIDVFMAVDEYFE